jgi:hypothetical protein
MANIFQAIAGAVSLFSLKGNAVAIDWGLTTHAMSDANYTLLDTQYINGTQKFTGTLSGTRNIVLPTTSGARFAVHNATTQSLVLKTTGGTGPTLAAGKTAWIYCDGTDYVQIGAASP